MAEVDPETLLEWLQMGQGKEYFFILSISLFLTHTLKYTIILNVYLIVFNYS